MNQQYDSSYRSIRIAKTIDTIILWGFVLLFLAAENWLVIELAKWWTR